MLSSVESGCCVLLSASEWTSLLIFNDIWPQVMNPLYGGLYTPLTHASWMLTGHNATLTGTAEQSPYCKQEQCPWARPVWRIDQRGN